MINKRCKIIHYLIKKIKIFYFYILNNEKFKYSNFTFSNFNSFSCYFIVYVINNNNRISNPIVTSSTVTQPTKNNNQEDIWWRRYWFNRLRDDKYRRQRDREERERQRDEERRRYYERELDRVRNYTDRRIREVEEQARTNNQEPINSNDGPDLTQPETVSEPVMTQPPVEIIEQNEPSVVEQATEMPSSSPSPDTSNTESFQNIDKLYLFYTMSCPYSQAMLPIWYRIRDSLPSSCVPIEIDCNDVKTKPICSSFGIRGVPTIILDKTNDNNGTYRIEYSGDNTMADIVEFLKENYVFVNRFTNVENFVNLDSTIDDVQPQCY